MTVDASRHEVTRDHQLTVETLQIVAGTLLLQPANATLSLQSCLLGLLFLLRKCITK